MPNLFYSLKSEISRITRREIKSSVAPIRSSTVKLKKTVAGLKKRIAVLEAANKRFLSFQKTHLLEQQPAEISPETAGKARITAGNVKSLREKLGLPHGAFGKLIGVSRQNVYIMESKKGRLRLRKKTLANILLARRMGKREAKKRLEEMGE
jgi:DNA-binding XRE family transcriptional regulator